MPKKDENTLVGMLSRFYDNKNNNCIILFNAFETINVNVLKHKEGVLKY